MIYQEYQKTCLPEGLTVVSEKIPSVRSVSIGVWVGTGTRYESQEQNGIAHFLEHMMFKSTSRRSTREIARSIESLGGAFNAFTGKEQTCYHVEILDEHLPRALDVLADILCRREFPKKEFEKEQRVILDEIQSIEDTPDELIHDYFMEKLFPGHSLGYPILGTPETVESFTPEALWEFYQATYCADTILIAAAGNLTHHRLVQQVEKKFSFPRLPHPLHRKPPGDNLGGEFQYQKPIQQAHICQGVPGYAFDHPRKYSLLLLNTILGGGMGSRLFQNIRERHGIAYGIYSFIDFFFDSGVLGVYLGTDKRNLSKVDELLTREFERLCSKPVSQRELREAKSQLKGNLVLSLESTAGRMNRLAMMEIYLNEFRSIDEAIQHIDEVTQESIWESARELLSPQRLLAVRFTPN